MKRERQQIGYLITWHLRDVDRYVGWGVITAPKVYVLMRARPHVSVTAFSGPQPWDVPTRKRVLALLQEASEPYRIGRHEVPARIEVSETMARSQDVPNDPDLVKWLCEALARIVGVAPHPLEVS